MSENNNSTYPVAKSNCFSLKMSNEQLIKALLSDIEAPFGLNYFKRDIKRKKQESSDSFYSRLHIEAQKIIGTSTEVSDIKNKYSWFKSGGLYYFFYITNSMAPSESLYEDLIRLSIDLEKIVQVLIRLRFNCFLISKISGEFEVSGADIQSELLLFSDITPLSKISDKVKIEAFQLDLYFSKYRDLFFNLHIRTFISNIGGEKVVKMEEGGFTFYKGQSRYSGTRVADARKYRDKRFMAFQQRYRGCTNYAQQYVFRYLSEFMRELNIVHSQKNICATSSMERFLTLSNKSERKLPLKIINTSGKPAEQAIQEYFGKNLGDTFHVEFIKSPQSIEDDSMYLFLNRKTGKDKQGSIQNVSTGEQYNTFWQALRIYLRERRVDCFDPYTATKLLNFINKRKAVTQGIDISVSSSGKLSGVNQHIIKRVAAELRLKNSVFLEKQLTLNEVVGNGDYELVYIRRPEGLMYASVTDVSIQGKKILINKQSVIDDEDELVFLCRYLDNMEQLRNDSFYIYDKSNKSFLTSYTSSAVPQIIGNVGFDNAEVFEESGTLRKLTAPHENPLPYYVNPSRKGQYHRVYLFNEPPNYYYFVSPKGNPQSSFDRQLRIYNLLVWDCDGHQLDQDSNNLTKLYLSTLTDNILKNGQVSKTSILVKIAKLPIEN